MPKKTPITSVNYWIHRLGLSVHVDRRKRKIFVLGKYLSFEEFVKQAKNNELC